MPNNEPGKSRRVSRPACGEPPDLYSDPAYASDLEDWTAKQSRKMGRRGIDSTTASIVVTCSGHGELILPLDGDGKTGDQLIDGLVAYTPSEVAELGKG